MEHPAPHAPPPVTPFWLGSPSRVRREAADLDRPTQAVRRAARDVEQLTQRASAAPETRPEAVARARRALRRGTLDSHTAIAAAVRAMRVGG